MLNFPLICQPCRNALFRLLSGSGCVKAADPPLADASVGARETLVRVMKLRDFMIGYVGYRRGGGPSYLKDVFIDLNCGPPL